MLFSIGYQKMKEPSELIDAIKPHGIKTIVDVRSQPNGRKFAFNKARLESELRAAGINYVWWGATLGGFAKIEEGAIENLAKWQGGEGTVACLMCMEADPDKCHRKYEIGRRLEAYGVEVQHLPLQVTDPQRPLF